MPNSTRELKINMETVKKYNGFNIGTLINGSAVVFTALFNVEKSLYLNLYKGNECIAQIDMLPMKIAGSVYSCEISIKEKDVSKITYDYTVDGITECDPYEKNHIVKRAYKEEANKDNFERSSLLVDDFDWEDDKYPNLKHSDVCGYSIHVRGFTKHTSSKVKHKGTYKGIEEKLDYLLDLGINQIELMPSYEFYEYNVEDKANNPKYQSDIKVDEFGNSLENKPDKMLNYWGFKKGHYLCPKAAYSSSKDFVNEFKNLVKTLHKNNIEVIMQFYFDPYERSSYILNILRFWHTVYHVDGFRLMGANIPTETIATDPVLLNAKIYVNRFNASNDYKNSDFKSNNIVEINADFQIGSRKLLKGDEDSLYNFLNLNRANSTFPKRINYLSCYEGFTLNDCVTFDYKHNESNGEDNRDGSDYNYSWNCGVEGPSKKKNIMALRLKQMKNAVAMLILSQAPFMLFMGDELMNSQDGNNNPYCHDSNVTWMNWNHNKQNTELLNFVKLLIKIRKENKVFHQDNELKIMDYKSFGYPDVSYHQENAWKCRFDNYLRHAGVLLFSGYADEEDKTLYYIAYNLHWENHEFGLPNIPKELKWNVVFETSAELDIDTLNSSLKDDEKILVKKRSIMLLKTVKNDAIKSKTKKK